MYSRYIPNGSGGYDREILSRPPGPLPQRPPVPQHSGPPGPPERNPIGSGPGPPGPSGQPSGLASRGSRPDSAPPTVPGRPHPPPTTALAGLLQRMDPEDLLILAVLLLVLRKDGADWTTVAIAGVLYFLIQ